MKLHLSIKVADLRNDSGSWLLVTHTYMHKYTATHPHLTTCTNKVICMSTHTYAYTKEAFHMYHVHQETSIGVLIEALLVRVKACYNITDSYAVGKTT